MIEPSVLDAEFVQLLGVIQAVGREIRVDIGEHDGHGREGGRRFSGQIGACGQSVYFVGILIVFFLQKPFKYQ